MYHFKEYRKRDRTDDPWHEDGKDQQPEKIALTPQPSVRETGKKRKTGRNKRRKDTYHHRLLYRSRQSMFLKKPDIPLNTEIRERLRDPFHLRGLKRDYKQIKGWKKYE